LYLKMDLRDYSVARVWSAGASSVLTEPGKDTNNLAANKAIDCDITTAWVEGVAGPGIDECITIDLGRDTKIYSIGIMPGFTASPEIYSGNNRPKKVRIDFSDGRSMTHVIPDAPNLNYIDVEQEFGGQIQTESIKITILEVYPGSKWDDTCISEITVNYDG
jgi:hypothetical protein